MPQLIDTHAHPDLAHGSEAPKDILSRARAEGVTDIIAIGICGQSSLGAAELAKQYEHYYASAGIHPNRTNEPETPQWWGTVQRLASEGAVVGIGETGADLFHDYSPLEKQLEYFIRHLDLAEATKLPVIIHCRDAEQHILPILRERFEARGPIHGVFHCFSGDEAMARECVDLGFYISFAGNVTYKNKKFESLRDAARVVPDERLLVETDSPFLSPEPHRGRKSGNEPAMVVHTARFLAELRGQDFETLARYTTENARRLFNLSE